MKKQGVLLAISSLPGKYGIGDFSNEAFDFIKILNNNNIDVWQILPLNPVGYGNSPYQPYSSFAFDEIYISLDDLVKRKLIQKVKQIPQQSHSNFELARKIKEQAIWKAYETFRQKPENIEKLDKFLSENPYVKEYVEFLTLKEFNDFKQWNEWKAIVSARQYDFDYAKAKHGFAQMILREQWDKIRDFARENGIQIIGDVPFYVGYDSSDVYYHKEAFLLDRENKPSCVAGVPPDYFSKVGQRWGNPIWDWNYLYTNGFKEMIERLNFASSLYDIIRIDHFRAFDSYWVIDPRCTTAIDGEWRYPDGYRFFNTLFFKYPNINIIVEDLGLLRPEVLTLRDHFSLPGMRIAEFSLFDDELYNKHIETENQIYYTSTHDNETLQQWCSKLKDQDKTKFNNRFDELGIEGADLCEKIIRYALRRQEKMVIIPISDVLKLNARYRMNKPGTVDTINWTFKLKNFNDLENAMKKFF